MHLLARLVLLVSLIWAAGAVSAQAGSAPMTSIGPMAAFRIGDHVSFGRLAVLLPAGVTCSASGSGEQEVLHFSRPVRLVGSPKDGGPGILGVVAGADELTLRLQPSSSVRIMTIGRRLVVDVFPPAPQAASPGIGASNADAKPVGRLPDAAASAGSVSASLLPGLPSPLVAVADGPPPARRISGASNAKPVALVTGAATSPVGGQSDVTAGPGTAHGQPEADGGPVSIAASIVPPDQGKPGGLMLPFDKHVGAAAYRRGTTLFVVFDSDKPVDLVSVAGDPVFGQAIFAVLPSGAVLTMTPSADAHPFLHRSPDGWLISMTSSLPIAATIAPRSDAGAVRLPVVEPGRVVTVPDPATGMDILVGTTRHEGQSLAPSRSGVGYALVSTILGVAVERLSDQLELRSASGGFVLDAPDGLEPLQVGLQRAAGNFSRSLDLPAADAQELQSRYKIAVAAAAALPLAARRGHRLDAAEAALALDRGRDAGEIAMIADEDAPSGLDQARSRFLQAAAAFLTQDPDATVRLADPRIDNSDEVVLWRALDLARRDPANGSAAHAIGLRLDLVKAYPARLRRHLLGEAALALVTAGDESDAGLVAGLTGDGSVLLAQALLAKRLGHDQASLSAFDGLVADPDPIVAEHAAEEAVTLRLKMHLFDAGHAAARLETRILDARMAGDELPVRLRIADLRAQQQDWPAALKELRIVSHDFPDAAGDVARRAGVILHSASLGASANKAASDQAPAVDGTEPAAGPVARLDLLESNLDLLPPGDDGAAISIAIAGQLAALDLADRASVLLRTAATRAPPGAGRARLGLELARLSLDQDDGAGALAALGASEAAGLPADLVASRAFMQARASAAAGDIEAALQSLEPLHDEAAEDLRAQELARKKDWAGEAKAVAALATIRLPAGGMLDGAGEDLVLRLAAAVARSGDQSELNRLAGRYAARFGDPGKLGMMRLLTSSSVTGIADLSRSASDLASAQSALTAVVAEPSKGGS
ncbi:hypothetical protein [Lichenicola sp.]|uniref:hypothetical protein n=1 Tax=Lichenicola sp. TaxID=2804529 RepID=UPI003B00EC1B